MKNTNFVRFVWIALAAFVIVGLYLVQNQSKFINAKAAEQLEKADTVEKIIKFLDSQNKKVQDAQNDITIEINKFADNNSKIQKFQSLLPAYQKFLTEVLAENIQAGEKILSLAKDSKERSSGYMCLLENCSKLSELEFTVLLQKEVKKAGLKETDADYETKYNEIVEKLFTSQVLTEHQKKLDAIIGKMEKEGSYEKLIRDYKGEQFYRNLTLLTYNFSIDKFNDLKNEIKKWAKGNVNENVLEIFKLLLNVSSSDKAATADSKIVEKTTKEIIDYITSDEFTNDVELRNQFSKQLKGIAARLKGADLNLYGRTINNEVFNWKSLRDKYVLVKFTASWCEPCKMEIPNMLKAYEKYHSKGLEIVSVYVFEEGSEKEAVANVKKVVNEEKIPWLVISEKLTHKAGEVEQSIKYGVDGVPTMLLVGKDGKVIATDMQGIALNKKLAEIFDK